MCSPEKDFRRGGGVEKLEGACRDSFKNLCFVFYKTRVN